jgi:hypothetical protein
MSEGLMGDRLNGREGNFTEILAAKSFFLNSRKKFINKI